MLSVSIIIPTYNGARYIAEALRSVFAQTLLPDEVIVVDDQSNDDTLQVVREAAFGAPVPVRIIRLSRNSGGPARPINTGVALARTELVVVLDQDDLFTPNKIESQARILSSNPSIAWTGSFCEFANSPNQEFSLQRECYDELRPTSHFEGFAHFAGRDVLRLLLLRGNFLVGYPAVMFRVVDWRAKGGVDESLPVASDYDLLCWLSQRGSVVLQPQLRYIRREHDANVCNNRQKMFLDIARVRGRYLAGNRWLLADQAVEGLRNWFLGIGYWLREGGNYRAAWECLQLAASVWGWNRLFAFSACKLPIHWLWRRVSGRSPVTLLKQSKDL